MVGNNPVGYVDQYGLDRSLMRDWKGHRYLRVDQYDEKGNKISNKVRLNFSIIGFTLEPTADDDGTILDTKCTTQAEDEALVEAWEEIMEKP